MTNEDPNPKGGYPKLPLTLLSDSTHAKLFREAGEFEKHVRLVAQPARELMEMQRVIKEASQTHNLVPLPKISSELLNSLHTLNDFHGALRANNFDISAITGILKSPARDEFTKALADQLDVARSLSIPKMTEMANDAMQIAAKFDQAFTIPSAASIDRIIENTSAYERIVKNLQAFDTATAKLDIGTYLHQVQLPWARVDDMITSATSVTNLHALRRVSLQAPFEPSSIEYIRTLLGDFRNVQMPTQEILLDPTNRLAFYQDRGFDTSLTDIPAGTFGEILGIPKLETEAVDAEQRAVIAYRIIRRFERKMRRFIDTVMTAKFGKSWVKRQVHPDIRTKWMEARESALARDEKSTELLDYADFSHYILIIERNDNWSQVFEPVFGRRTDIVESFQRLMPLRIPTMHARTITLEDLLILKVETNRILRRIRQ